MACHFEHFVGCGSPLIERRVVPFCCKVVHIYDILYLFTTVFDIIVMKIMVEELID